MEGGCDGALRSLSDPALWTGKRGTGATDGACARLMPTGWPVDGRALRHAIR